MGVTNPGSFLRNIPSLCDKAAECELTEGTPFCEEIYQHLSETEAAAAAAADGSHWLLSWWFGTSVAAGYVIK